jgi:hypothetical protein
VLSSVVPHFSWSDSCGFTSELITPIINQSLPLTADRSVTTLEFREEVLDANKARFRQR